MNSTITMYITLICISGIFNSFLGYYVYVHRKGIIGAYTFIFYAMALSLYSFSYALELASDKLSFYMFWNAIEWLAMPMSVPLGVLTIYYYLGKRFTRAGLIGFFSMPVITWFIYLTNDYHHLFFKVYEFREDIISIDNLEMAVGEWYIIFNVYVFCCWLASLLLLIGRWRQTRNVFRLQLFTLMCGQLTPMFTGLLFLLGITPAGLDPVPLGLCVTSGLYIWVIMSTKMLTIVPIAKEKIFYSMGEGVIVLDSAERLIDFNIAASQMIPDLQSTMIGKTMDEIWNELTSEPFPFRRLSDGHLGELAWTSNNINRFYQVRSSSILHQNDKLAGSLLMFIDVTELKHLQQELEHQAFYDGLTQIMNRTQFILRCREMLVESRISAKPCTIILFDIDYFKRVNDTYGHETGDKIIVHVVSICKRLLSEKILFARYGGEEFVLALPAYTLQEGISLGERLRASMEAEPLSMEQGTIAVTSSFGVVSLSGDETLDTMLRNADEALYSSKRNGRNRVTSYSSSSLPLVYAGNSIAFKEE